MSCPGGKAAPTDSGSSSVIGGGIDQPLQAGCGCADRCPNECTPMVCGGQTYLCATDGCAAIGCDLVMGCGSLCVTHPIPCITPPPTCECDAPAGNCACGPYCSTFMQPCAYQEMMAKWPEQMPDGLETCRCLPHYPPNPPLCECGPECAGNGTPNCSPMGCGHMDCTGSPMGPVCGCEPGLWNCTPGQAGCQCNVANLGYCTDEPCGQCPDYCFEEDCPKCGDVTIQITEANPAGPNLYINLGQTSSQITAHVTRNGQPVEGVRVHWILEDPDEPWGPSYLDPVRGRYNCDLDCPDEGKNGKTNCLCANRPPGGNCPAHDDAGEPNNASDNWGGGNLDPREGTTGADGLVRSTLTLQNPCGGDNWIVRAVICPKPPKHPHGMSSDVRDFSVWRRVQVEVDAMEDGNHVPDAFEPAYDELGGAHAAAYIEIVTYDHQDNCHYVATLTTPELHPYGDLYFVDHLAYTIHLMGIRENFDPPDGGPWWGDSTYLPHAFVCTGTLQDHRLENKVCIHETGHHFGGTHAGPPHADQCVMEQGDVIHELCAACIEQFRRRLAFE